jgi:hypothetical protein
MISGSALKPDIRTELWHSFSVLLKSYAAAASLNGVEHGALDLNASSLHIAAGRSILKVGYYFALGRGVWSIFIRGKQELGNFELHPDGTVSVDNQVLDMDHAAIQIIGVLTSAANLDRVEVPA